MGGDQNADKNTCIRFKYYWKEIQLKKLCLSRRQLSWHVSGLRPWLCLSQHSVRGLWCRIMQIQFGDEMKPGGITNMTDGRIKILTGWVTALKLTRRIMVKLQFSLFKTINSCSTEIGLELARCTFNGTIESLLQFKVSQQYHITTLKCSRYWCQKIKTSVHARYQPFFNLHRSENIRISQASLRGSTFQKGYSSKTSWREDAGCVQNLPDWKSKWGIEKRKSEGEHRKSSWIEKSSNQPLLGVSSKSRGGANMES